MSQTAFPAAIASAGFLLCLSASVPAGLVTNIPLPPGETASVAADVNGVGVVVGVTYHNQAGAPLPTPVFSAFRWTAAGGTEVLGAAGTQRQANAVNSGGTVVGWSGSSTGSGFRYTPPGPIQSIPNGGPANGINASGVVVGATTGFTPKAYRYDPATGITTNLGTLGGTQSQANDINDFGVTVGWTHVDGTMTKRAFRQSGTGPMENLGVPQFSTESEAVAINNAGTIVGKADFAYFKLSGNGPMQSLPLNPQDINDAGFIVGGTGTSGSGLERAALYTPSDALINLDTWLDQRAPAEGAMWTLNFAFGVSNNGWIVGRGMYNDGPGGESDGSRAFLLDASALVPEPASLASVLVAATFLVRRPRRA